MCFKDRCLSFYFKKSSLPGGGLSRSDRHQHWLTTCSLPKGLRCPFLSDESPPFLSTQLLHLWLPKTEFVSSPACSQSTGSPSTNAFAGANDEIVF